MTEIQIRPAVREAIGLLIGLAGGTGSGKTYSALRIASGLTSERFCLIDTEHGRALHYADEFAFDHAPLEPPFTPARYLEAIHVVAARGYPVIIVDSFSHEYAGEGGVLDMQEAELARLGGGENVKMLSWSKPKQAHKKLVRELIRLDAHLILCFRAEPKVEMVKDEHNKWQIVPKPTLTGLEGWVPITEKSFPHELTISALLLAENPGVPKPIKLPERLRDFVPVDVPLSERVGASLGEWAKGSGEIPSFSPDTLSAAESPPPPPADRRSPAGIPGRGSANSLTAEQAGALDAIVGPLLRENRIDRLTLWTALAMERVVDVDDLIVAERGRDENGELHWGPLRDALTKAEASAWIDRLSRYAAKPPAS